MNRRNRALAIAILALMVVGCLGPRPPEPSPSVDPKDDRSLILEAAGCAVGRHPVFHDSHGLAPSNVSSSLSVPCAIPTGTGTHEPTIGVCPKTGALFTFPSSATVNGDMGSGRTVLRTLDEGKTWSKVMPSMLGLGTHRASLDPYLYLDRGTCRLFVSDFLASCSTLSYTDDRGATWTTAAANCGQSDHQSVFAGPPVGSPTVGYPNIVYQCAINPGFGADASASNTCQKSLDGGKTWVPTGSPPFASDPQMAGRLGVPGGCDGPSGHGTVGATGLVYLPKGLCGQPFLAISQDEGLTWTRRKVSDIGMPVMDSPQGAYIGHDASVGVDQGGTIYYAWAAADRLPYLAISRDAGATWSTPLMIGPPGLVEASLVQITVGPPGRVAAVYLGSMNSPGNFPTTSKCDPNLSTCASDLAGSAVETPAPAGYERVTWNAYITQTWNALDANPLFETASLNDPTDPLVRGYCGPIRCPGVGDFIDIELGPDDTPWTSFADACTGACASGDVLENNDDRGMVGRLLRDSRALLS